MIRLPESYRAFGVAAKKQGWVITTTGSGHLKWTDPDGRTTFTPRSPSANYKGLIRVKTKLKKAGLIL